MEGKLGQRCVEAQVSRTVAVDDTASIKFKAAVELGHIGHNETQAVGIKPQDSVARCGFIQFLPAFFWREERAEIAAVHSQLIIKAVGHPGFLFSNTSHINRNANRYWIDMSG